MSTPFFLFILLLCNILPSRSQVIVNNNTCLNPNGSDCYGVQLNPTGFGSVYGQPLYTIAELPATPDNYDIDNVCATYTAVGGNITLLTRSTVFKNGSYSIGRFIEKSSSDLNNAFRSQGLVGESGCSTCVFNTYIIVAFEGSCSGVYAYYRCQLFGACPASVIYGGIVATSPPENVSADCYKKALAEFRSQGQNFTDVCDVQLPNRLPRRCVTSVCGAPTIGSGTVACQDRLDLTTGCE